MFISLEDETGISNLIVRPSIQTQQRDALFNSRLMVVEGELQSESGSIHFVTHWARNYTHWPGQLDMSSSDVR